MNIDRTSDAAKNVVFEWRSWDHFDLTDMTFGGFALTDSVIDYVHGNSIEVDGEEGLLVSSRNLNEITKIIDDELQRKGAATASTSSK